MGIHRFMQRLLPALGGIVGIIGGWMGANLFLNLLEKYRFEQQNRLSISIGLMMVGLLLGILMGITGFRLLTSMAHRLEEMEPDEKFAIAASVLVAALVTIALYPILFAVGGIALGWVLTLLFFSVTVYLGSVTFLSMKEYLPITAQMARRSRGVKVLDTNVIIDGRIADIMRAGFLEGRIYVPGFVLDELQQIADSTDPLKRARGRRGLDVLKRLQQDFTLELRTQDRLAPPGGEGVDARLVRLAKAMHADIVTNDYNLNQVAELQGVRVLNINELAEAVRIHVLPGEELTVTIIREGKEPDQGVAYLEDGTMVVVEGGKAHLNETVEVVVTSVFQTSGGKMIFAAPKEELYEIEEGGHERSLRAYIGGRKRRPIR